VSTGISVETNATDAEVVRNNTDGDKDKEDEKTGSAGFSGDRYCGNCAFYEYAEVEGTSVPFCEYHERELDDLEACDHHEMRTGSSTRTVKRTGDY